MKFWGKIFFLFCCVSALYSKPEKLIEAVYVNRNKVTINVHRAFLKKYLKTNFFAEYDHDIDLSQLDQSIIIMPFLMNVISLVWISGKEYSINSLDYDLYHALEQVHNVFKLLYPNTAWDGKIIPKKLVKNKICADKDYHVAMVFSGGLDSLATSFKHMHHQQLLITAWGHADTPLDSRQQWRMVRQQVKDFAQEYGHTNSFVRSNYYAFLQTKVIDRLSPEVGHWRTGAIEGLGWVGLAAPILVAKGCTRLLIASSISYDCPYVSAANPLVDNALSFAGIQVNHDGFELARVDKAEYVVKYCEEKKCAKPCIRVCQKNKDGGNCCKCIKCFQTIIALLAVGANHQDYGFRILEDDVITFAKMLFVPKTLPFYKFWHYECIQKMVRKRIEQRVHASVFMTWLAHQDLKSFLKDDDNHRELVDWRMLLQDAV